MSRPDVLHAIEDAESALMHASAALRAVQGLTMVEHREAAAETLRCASREDLALLLELVSAKLDQGVELVGAAGRHARAKVPLGA